MQASIQNAMEKRQEKPQDAPCFPCGRKKRTKRKNNNNQKAFIYEHKNT